MKIRELKTKAVWAVRDILTYVSPSLNTRFLFWWYMKENPNLSNPKTLNEKVSWLKLHSYKHNPDVKRCADKFRVREYIEEKGLGQLLIPLIAVYDTPNDILWEELPQQFALKLNVGCGCNLICTDKALLDMSSVKKMLNRWDRGKYYLHSAEWQYKDVEKKYIVEKCLPIKNGKLPTDYKFYCFHGRCEAIMVCTDRVIGNGAKFFYLDRDWVPFTNYSYCVEKPKEFDRALGYAEKLAGSFPIVRVDLFIEDDEIYFGELTFTPAAGIDTDLKFIPSGKTENLDSYLGSLIKNL